MDQKFIEQKDNLYARGARLIKTIEEKEPGLIGGFGDAACRRVESALVLRIEDLKDQAITNTNHDAHLELVGSVKMLREIIATIQYARM